jgi:RNA polymerase sigma-70 factor (ECF subfamily)
MQTTSGGWLRSSGRARLRLVSIDWEDVYRASHADVVRYLYRKVWDAERAQELAQEVFVRVLGQQPDNPRALVFTVATNLARDEARSVIRRRKHLSLMRSDTDALVSATPNPEQSAEMNEQTRMVEHALDQLSERDRDVLLLWDAGLSYTEIAEQTGLAIGAIGTTLGRARKRLVDAYAAAEGKNHVARG